MSGDSPQKENKMEVKRVEDQIGGSKRTHVPYEITGRCPACSEPISIDLSQDYHLSYPIWGEPGKVYCTCDACDYEWAVKVVADISLRICDVPDEEEEGIPEGAILMNNPAPRGWVEVQADDVLGVFAYDEDAARAVSSKAREFDGHWYVPADKSKR